MATSLIIKSTTTTGKVQSKSVPYISETASNSKLRDWATSFMNMSSNTYSEANKVTTESIETGTKTITGYVQLGDETPATSLTIDLNTNADAIFTPNGLKCLFFCAKDSDDNLIKNTDYDVDLPDNADDARVIFEKYRMTDGYKYGFKAGRVNNKDSENSDHVFTYEEIADTTTLGDHKMNEYIFDILGKNGYATSRVKITFEYNS